MTTETKIAKENIENRNPNGTFTDVLYKLMITHKQSCQRFLEFLEYINTEMETNLKPIKVKITDLKQAIKLYEDAGI